MTHNPDTHFAPHADVVLRDGEHAVITFKGQVVGSGTFVVSTDEHCGCNDIARSLSMRFVAGHASRIERVLTFPTAVGSVIKARLKGEGPDAGPELFWFIDHPSIPGVCIWMSSTQFCVRSDMLGLVEVCFDAGKVTKRDEEEL